MLLAKDNSCLVLVDVQEKLTPHVLNHTNLIMQCDWMIRLAQKLSVPMVVCEQYPSGLGSTVHALSHFAPAFPKVHFSGWRDTAIQSHLKSLNKKQVVLIGIEAHVCVLQMALDLLHADYDVFVVLNAVSSRTEQDLRYGLKRIKQAGGEIVTAEMVFFEWVEQAGTPEFKVLSKAFLQGLSKEIK